MMVLCFVQQCVDCDWLRWNDRKGVFFCPLFNWFIRDIYRRRTLEIQAKMGANWPPESRNRNWDNIFMLSVRKDVLWVRVIFVCICSHLSNCHFNDTIVNKCDICRIPTFRSSLRGSFVATELFWLISRVKIVPYFRQQVHFGGILLLRVDGRWLSPCLVLGRYLPRSPFIEFALTLYHIRPPTFRVQPHQVEFVPRLSNVQMRWFACDENRSRTCWMSSQRWSFWISAIAWNLRGIWVRGIN